ncbi:MAG: ATP-dependent RecD-like DNA helicase [Ruminococcaceae bacterium]|nr:ATP-dependent RecD-like DNA helicase [Oscillospiraceae bacterium]
MEENLEKLNGSVDEIVFSNTETGYVVFDLDCNGQIVTVVGELGNISEGERLELTGGFVYNAKYGRQFRAVTCIRTLPTTPMEIRKYLGSGIIKGLGPALAKKIVEHFGSDSLDIIENDPISLSDINGITSDKALFISSEYRKLSGMKTVIEFLQKFDITPAVAAEVWKKYETSSIAFIKENPYILCDEAIGVDFDRADAIALSEGISGDSTNRIIAGLMFILRENADAGHVCLPVNKLVEVAQEILVLNAEAIHRGMDEALGAKQLSLLTIGEKSYIYLNEYYRAEKYIADKLAFMLKMSGTELKDWSEEIKGVEFTESIQYEEMQKAAINGCLGNKVFILTGGPGTGKTTTLNGIIRLLKLQKKSMVLAAPTGRAAKRMSEVTGENAKTIHRLLEVDPTVTDRIAFKKNEKSPLKADVVIVDEMSMVDVLLLEALLRALKTSASLIMVGDSHQLPSVGAGNVLKDLIAAKDIPTVELTKIFRQAAESLIVTNAHKIVKGVMPELNDRKNDFFFMSCPNELEVPKLVIQLTKTRLPKSYGFSPLEDIQILTPTRLGCTGTKELNRNLQLALNPPSKGKGEIKVFDTVFRVGDKVMQIKNDYDIEWQKGAEHGQGVFNGDIGYIENLDKYSGNVVVNFDGRKAEYTAEMMRKLDLAYAVTIHKSQGSEYNAVILPLTSINNLMYRNLLYTGVTRAKKILIIIGTREQVETMVNNNRRTLRYSCVRPLLKIAIKNSGKE